ncbi:Short-chain dehydrogenase [Hyella patelloides LEGE 07179]|uniref:Short-chain dehydrogenase n=1 Tax=Hyella patelloides LEGE 07179 TaxID=945734 RepID=A0A563VTZ7_9CYAN|nr:3-oxoacyl-ACP reductase FabG [Hyella patelloides]VEP14920.1 Short-chain dehydrogenase [Hyella patelloides LEGE 07179]
MKDKKVLLTGGTGGLGRGILPSVLSQGASVVIPYLKERYADSVRGMLTQEQLEQVTLVKADLTKESNVSQIVKDMGKVEVLIHLVGGFDMGEIHQYSLDDWHKTFNINLLTTFLTCKHSLQSMREHNYGRIVTVGSRGAVDPAPQLAAYSAAKAGVVALTQAIAKETQKFNITANTVLPSVIDTPTNREAMGEENANQWVKPASLAKVICFLASEASQDVSGAAIPVYGDA